MREHACRGVVAVVFACSCLNCAIALSATASRPKPAADPGWPREITGHGDRLVYYQPQIDQWRDYQELTARIAFSLKPNGGSVVHGFAQLRAITRTDLVDRLVLVRTVELPKLSFLAPLASQQSLKASFLRLFPTKGMIVSLDRMMAAVPPGPPAKPVLVKTDPPEIFTSEAPAILLRWMAPLC